MQNFIKKLNDTTSEKVRALLKKGNSFALSGITNSAKLVLLSQMALEGKKLLFVVDSEQLALKFRNDLKIFLDKEVFIFPYQDCSIYDTNSKNLYKYAAQADIINNLKDIVIIPSKALFEKFPEKKFFKKHSIKIKNNEDTNVTELSQKLVEMGYKRKTLVADIGEFSIRGDVIDIFPLSKNPVRIELWGDTVTDIRYFSASNQRSIEKIKETDIQPVYKFILDDNSYKKIEDDDEKSLEITEKLKNKDYFEGIEYFENVFNPDLKTITELLYGDYIIVFDDYTQFKSKYEQACENLTKQYEENVQGGLTLPLKMLNHLDLTAFLTTVSGYQKVYFDNFLSEEFDINIELQTELIPFFASGLDSIADFIDTKLKEQYVIVTATDYKKRIEEIFNEYEIPLITKNLQKMRFISRIIWFWQAV